jgi:hypothetical protein
MRGFRWNCHVQVVREAPESVACWRQLQKELDRLRGQNVIVSDERLSSEDHLQGEVMLGRHAGLLQNWRVIVVVGYQRYSECMLSFKSRDERLPSDTKWPEDTRLHTLSNPLYIQDVLGGCRGLPGWYR